MDGICSLYRVSMVNVKARVPASGEASCEEEYQLTNPRWQGLSLAAQQSIKDLLQDLQGEESTVGDSRKRPRQSSDDSNQGAVKLPAPELSVHPPRNAVLFTASDVPEDFKFLVVAVPDCSLAKFSADSLPVTRSSANYIPLVGLTPGWQYSARLQIWDGDRPASDWSAPAHITAVRALNVWGLPPEALPAWEQNLNDRNAALLDAPRWKTELWEDALAELEAWADITAETEGLPDESSPDEQQGRPTTHG